MHVSEFLADLTSLQACDPKASIALVTTTPPTLGVDSVTDDKQIRNEGADADLKRAQDLLDLHATVKLAHQKGADKEVIEAREAVARALESLS